jgi:hypothetical protein
VRIITVIIALMLAGDTVGAAVLGIAATSHGPQPSKVTPLHANLLPAHPPVIIPGGRPRNLEPYNPIHPSPMFGYR